jgi:hypothetical protein
MVTEAKKHAHERVHSYIEIITTQKVNKELDFIKSFKGLQFYKQAIQCAISECEAIQAELEHQRVFETHDEYLAILTELKSMYDKSLSKKS